MQVKIFDSNRKKYSKHYRPTSSTTLDWHFVQPLFSRLVMPNSSLKFKANQFVRLSPLTFPVFGDIRLVNKAFFVPIEQVMPSFSAFLSGKPYTTPSGDLKTTKCIPFTTNSELWCLLVNSLRVNRSWNPQTNIYGNYYYKTTSNVVTINNVLNASPLGCDEVVSFDNLHVDNNTFVQCCKDILKDETLTIDEVSSKVASIIGYSSTELVQLVVDGTEDISVKDKLLAAISSSDYSEYTYFKSGDTEFPQNVFYTLNSRGRALRKILIGLGYNPCLDDDTPVSILPMLAFYKAYFDNMYPKRYIDWEETAAYGAIQLLSTVNYENQYTSMPTTNSAKRGAFAYDTAVAVNLPNPWLQVAQYLRWFFYGELARCYSVEDMDFISAHTPSISNLNVSDGYPYAPQIVPSNVSQPSVGSVASLSDDDVSTFSDDASRAKDVKGAYIYVGGDKPITKWSLQFLNRLQSYFNKDSIIGNRISSWMRSHFDSDTLNLIYDNTKCLATSMSTIGISDIDSTADTLSSDGQTGNSLGAYCGKGIGKCQLSFTCKSSTFGFVIVLTYVLPVTGYYQGTSPELIMSDRYSLPSSEFDAIGYEVTPKAVMFTNNDISLRGRADNPSYKDGDDDKTNWHCKLSDGFGYMPRMSQYKYIKNMVNGDFSLGSTKSVMRAFYVDKDIISNAYPYKNIANGSDTPISSYKISHTPIPNASSLWQYVSKYEGINDYQRIFQNSYLADPTAYRYGAFADDLLNDNFLLHSVFEIEEYNSLKPLELSYDTDVDGGPSSSIHPA